MNDVNNIRRPTAALINREWYESSRRLLSKQALGDVLVACVDYVLYGEDYLDVREVKGVVFNMIKPALDSDISKYNERCARNAANAKRKASSSEWQRVGASGTSGEQPQPQPQPQHQPQPQPLSQEDGVRENREKFLIFGYFWSTGSEDPMGESVAFWSYYESLGWKNNKGAAIVNKIAAARMWRRQYAMKEPCDHSIEWYKAFSTADTTNIQVFTAYRGARLEGSQWVITLRCDEDFAATFTANYRQQLAALQRALGGLPLEFIRQS